MKRFDDAFLFELAIAAMIAGRDEGIRRREDTTPAQRAGCFHRLNAFFWCDFCGASKLEVVIMGGGVKSN
jgi:hypothetical protein